MRAGSVKLRACRRKMKFETYGYVVNVAFASDINKYCEKRWPNQKPEEKCEAFTLIEEKTSQIVLPFDATPALIAHESSHVVWGIMKFIGAEFEDEVVAYHLGHLVGQIHRWLDDIKKKDALAAEKEIKKNEGTNPSVPEVNILRS